MRLARDIVGPLVLFAIIVPPLLAVIYILIAIEHVQRRFTRRHI